MHTQKDGPSAQVSSKTSSFVVEEVLHLYLSDPA
jgi:hypothetical protein